MIETMKKAIRVQLDAALSMLDECVKQCPDDKWTGLVGNQAFWHVAYHVLFFTDLYLSRDEQSFAAPSFHREDYHFLGTKPMPPYEPVVADNPYERDIIAGYIETCRDKASQAIGAETRESLEGPSGFYWYEIPRLELYFVVIRHVQHHAAQMSLYLRNTVGLSIDWVGSGWNIAESDAT